MSGFKQCPGGAQQLTTWIGFHEGISVIQIESRRYTTTHFLDGILWGYNSDSIEPRRYTTTHSLDKIS